MNNQAIVQRDLQVLWHPCSQMKDHDPKVNAVDAMPLIPIKSGQGVWLEDFEGKRYLDAISSWWVNIFGHANPVINQAIKQQLDTLEHVILGGFTHEAALTLAEKLVEITPAGLDKCFYADNGSSAVEVALKMSFHYWRNCGKSQKKQIHHIGKQLPRRNAWRAGCWKCSLIQGNLCAVADECHHCTWPRLLLS